MTPYDTLLDKDELLIEHELRQFSEASSITADRAMDWVLERSGPDGPVAVEQDLSLIYKTVTAFGLAGRTADEARLLDWVQAHAVAESGDLYFAELEPCPGVYRQSWILRRAAESGHALARLPRVRARMLQYQTANGGVRDSVGYDAAAPTPDEGCSVAATCGFGLYAISAGLTSNARDAGRWLVSLVEQNSLDMDGGAFYFRADAEGRPERDVPPGQDFGFVVRDEASMQPTWVLGLAMAFLADLTDELLTSGEDATLADEVARAAETLAQFQDRMPLETYFSWNSCKLAWSAGRMLDVWLRHGRGDLVLFDQLYRAGRRTYMHTFLGTRRSDGAWGHDFYPLSSDAPETEIDQRTLEGLSAVPSPEEWQAHRQPDDVVGIDPIEISAENLVMLLHLIGGFGRLRSCLPDLLRAARSHT